MMLIKPSYKNSSIDSKFIRGTSTRRAIWYHSRTASEIVLCNRLDSPDLVPLYVVGSMSSVEYRTAVVQLRLLFASI
jgi:hypothetical protein